MRAAMILAGLVLVVLIVAGVMNVQSVDRVQTVAEKSVVVDRSKAEDQLDRPVEPADGNPEQGGGQASEQPAQPEAPAAEVPVPADSQAEVDHSNCADPMICKNDDCLRDYAIVFTSAHCGPCKTMHGFIAKMQSEGFRIYYWDTAQFPVAFTKFKVDAVPTTFFFNEGRQQQKYVGVIGEKVFRQLLTPRPKKSPAPVGDKPVYNLIGE